MEYQIKQVQERGEWGQGMVDYALMLEGHDGWVKLTQKKTTPAPAAGTPITGRIEVKTNVNGKSYFKFTKERVDGFGGGNRSATQSPSQSSSQEAYIVQMLEELTGRRPVHEGGHPKPEDSRDNGLDDPFKELGI